MIANRVLLTSAVDRGLSQDAPRRDEHLGGEDDERHFTSQSTPRGANDDLHEQSDPWQDKSNPDVSKNSHHGDPLKEAALMHVYKPDQKTGLRRITPAHE